MALQFNSKINLVVSFDFTEGYILELWREAKKFKKKMYLKIIDITLVIIFNIRNDLK